jgi:hypothetical protein
MPTKRLRRIARTTLSNEQLRLIEVYRTIYDHEQPKESWRSWLERRLVEEKPLKNDLPMPRRFEIAIRNGFTQTFYTRLQLDRIESMLSMVLDRIAPTMTFAEVKALLRYGHSDAEIEGWLAGNSLIADKSGQYHRADVVRAFGNPQIDEE